MSFELICVPHRLCHEWINRRCQDPHRQSPSRNTSMAFSSSYACSLFYVVTATHLFLVFKRCSLFSQNHWFTYNETMTVESVTQAVSNLALQFGEEDADPGAMVSSLRIM